MTWNRKGVALGIVGLGVVAAVGGGAGVALAATGPNGSGSAAPCAGGGGGSMFGTSMGQGAPMTAAADYLGLSLSELRTQLQAGTSLADVAKAQGKSVSGLEDAILAAMTARLDANTGLTAEQKATRLAQIKEGIDDMVNATHAAGSGFGGTGAGMGGMRR